MMGKPTLWLVSFPFTYYLLCVRVLRPTQYFMREKRFDNGGVCKLRTTSCYRHKTNGIFFSSSSFRGFVPE